MVVVRSITTLSFMPAGMTACNSGIRATDAIDGIDDVGVGLAEDDEEDGGFAVGEAFGADIGDGILRRRRHPRDEPARRWSRRRAAACNLSALKS